MFESIKNFFRNLWERAVDLYHWMRSDGLLHASLSALLILILCPIVGSFFAIVGTVAVGVGKEVYDEQSGKGYAEIHDIICDGLGIIFGLLIYLLYII